MLKVQIYVWEDLKYLGNTGILRTNEIPSGVIKHGNWKMTELNGGL
jgi:hypothetical protein